MLGQKLDMHSVESVLGILNSDLFSGLATCSLILSGSWVAAGTSLRGRLGVFGAFSTDDIFNLARLFWNIRPSEVEEHLYLTQFGGSVKNAKEFKYFNESIVHYGLVKNRIFKESLERSIERCFTFFLKWSLCQPPTWDARSA